ncbi:MAG: BamA/TamA family outer membrane protein [Ignavibacteriae bacterium]|nr:BamA/TamA family outer membrane protein [Ignavibacteriota bacterium]
MHRKLPTLLVLWILFITVGLSQGKRYEISSISFEGNDTFSDSELMQLLLVRETPGFISKTLHGMFEALGRPEEFLDVPILAEDVGRLRQLYRDHGFQDVVIDTSLAFRETKSRVDITFKIMEGYRSKIDTLIYRGIVDVPPQVIENLSGSAFIKQGDYFSKVLLDEEVKRIMTMLTSEGYARPTFVRDSSWARYRTSTRNYEVVLTFELNQRYRFGKIVVQNEDSTRTDIQPEAVVRQLDFEEGSLYDTRSITTSERNLNRLGIFDLARISVSVPTDDFNSVLVGTTVRVRPKDKHEFAPEITFSDENTNFNLGLGLGYSHRNFLGGLRTASTRVRFRTATLKEFPDFFQLETDAVANLDLTFELIQPYVFSNKIRGSWSLSWIRDKQKIYLSTILQNKFSLAFRFAEFTTGYLDWAQQLVKLQKRPNYTINMSDVNELRQLRDLELQAREEQFNSIVSFTIQRDMTNDIFSPSRGFIHALTLEESGVLPLVLDKLGWVDRPFTQFYRVNVIGRWYYDLTSTERFSVFAMKLRAGLEEKYGASRSDTSRVIPQTHRFYAGGSGSVRGWRLRELSATGDPQLGGNLILEGGFELRINVLQKLKDDFWDRLWTVLFLDFGNVWANVSDVNARGIAAAAGFGIRYDTFFGPFRIDYGFRVYDPRPPASEPGKHWITQRKFFSETFAQGIVHFGIGHAF